MFSLSVNDHIMIAHSLPHEFFGPAQALHGATLAVEVTFTRAELDEHCVVMDIGEASQLLDDALTPLRYANLDEHPDFTGRLSTSEAIAEHIGASLSVALKERPDVGICVHLRENPRAAVSYTVPKHP